MAIAVAGGAVVHAPTKLSKAVTGFVQIVQFLQVSNFCATSFGLLHDVVYTVGLLGEIELVKMGSRLSRLGPSFLSFILGW